MKKPGFSDRQIIEAIERVEAGSSVPAQCRGNPNEWRREPPDGPEALPSSFSRSDAAVAKKRQCPIRPESGHKRVGPRELSFRSLIATGQAARDERACCVQTTT